MSDVQFDEENSGSAPNQLTHKTPYFISVVFKTGITSDEKIAEYILFGFIGVALLLTISTFWNIATPPEVPVIPQEILMEMN